MESWKSDQSSGANGSSSTVLSHATDPFIDLKMYRTILTPKNKRKMYGTEYNINNDVYEYCLFRYCF